MRGWLGWVFMSIAIAAILQVFSGTVAAAPASLPRAEKEPERFAFVVGNGSYQFNKSDLGDLADACDEAVQFRAKLISIGWSQDHIYPLASAPKDGESQDDAIRAAVCDLKNADLSRKLADFVNIILINQNNPYGVLYYAGHGAESNDEYFAFGVDTTVDLDSEMKIVLTYPDYEIFSRPPSPGADGPIAVNITRIIKAVNGPQGKALLAIIDACRDDPLLEKFNAGRIPPSKLSEEQRRRLSLGYLSSKSDNKYDSIFRNIIVMYATRRSRLAASGTSETANRFSTDLLNFMSKDVNLKDPALTFVGNFETGVKKSQGGLNIDDRQIPQHIGSVASVPTFCFRNCPQPLEVWRNESVEIVAEAPEAGVGRNSAGIAASRPVGGAAKVSRSLTDGMMRIAYVRGGGAQVRDGAAPLDQAEAPKAMPVQTGAEMKQPARPLNLDVFYCSGDAGEAGRRDQAQAFARAFREQNPRSSAVAATYIDQVRLRSFDINTNLSLQHPRVLNSIVLVASDPASPYWGDRVKSSFDRVYSDDITKGYFRAYFCKGFDPAQKPRPSVVAQVSYRNQVDRAKEYMSAVASALPDVRVISGVEPVEVLHPSKSGKPHAPLKTQVRYFADRQRSDADRIAQVLAALIPGGVDVVDGRGGTPPVKSTTNPIIEVWFGSVEMARW